MHPPGVAGGAAGEAGAGRGGAIPAEIGMARSGGEGSAGLLPKRGALRAVGGDQLDLQEKRAHPQGPQPGGHAGLRLGGGTEPATGGDRQPEVGWAADPGVGQQGSAGDLPGGERGCAVHPGAHLDAALCGSGGEFGVRQSGGVLRGVAAAHLRGGDRTVVGSAYELAAVGAGPLRYRLEFGRALAAKVGARGDLL